MTEASLSTGAEADAAAAEAVATAAAEAAATAGDPGSEGIIGTPEEIAAAKVVADKAAADKEGEEKVGAPEAYEDFTLPEGMELDTVAVEAALPVFKELGLTQDQAQKLVDLQAAQLTAAAEAQQVQWDKTNEDWREEAKADPEFGRANLQGSLAHVKTFLDKFATPEFREMLDDTGLGNRLETLRMFATVGKAMGEDSITTGPASITSAKSVAEKMFPNQAT